METLFDHILFNFAAVVGSIVMLWKGAEWLVEAACRLANFLGVSELIIGLTIVAIGTSAPEFAVSVSSALEGNPEIAVGNVFGSNIFNLGFVLGLGVLFSNLKTTPITIYRDGAFLLFSVVFLYFLIFGIGLNFFSGGYLHPISAGILIIFLISYVAFLYLKKTHVEDIPKDKFKYTDVLLLLLGLGLVVLGGHFLVENSVKIGQHVGLSNWIIGVTIIAAGTSAPELVTTLVSIIKKRYNVAVGNLIGSDLFNILGVIGVAGVVSGGIHVPAVANISLLMLLANLLIILFFIRTSWKLVRWEGIALISLSFVRYYIDFFLVKTL